MGKKDRCAVFECNDAHLFPQKNTLKFSFLPVNTERVPSGHPIILLKSNKFNMAAVSVKRSIECDPKNSFAFQNVSQTQAVRTRRPTISKVQG